MLLFDVLRELNDHMNLLASKGEPGVRVPLLVAITDGYRVRITFMDRTVWDSDEWGYETDDEEYELNRIREHLKSEVNSHLNFISNIRF